MVTSQFLSCLQGGGGGAGGGVEGSHTGQAEVKGVSFGLEAYGQVSTRLRDPVHLCSELRPPEKGLASTAQLFGRDAKERDGFLLLKPHKTSTDRLAAPLDYVMSICILNCVSGLIHQTLEIASITLVHSFIHPFIHLSIHSSLVWLCGAAGAPLLATGGTAVTTAFCVSHDY